MKQWAEHKLKTTVRLLAGVITVIVILTLPAISFYTQSQNLSTSLQRAADVAAHNVSEYVFQYPDTWMYQEARLIGLLERHLQMNKQQALLISQQHAVHVSTGMIEAKPAMVRRTSVNDGIRKVAVVEIQGSLSPIIAQTAFIFLFSLFLGLMIFVSLYYWPLEALKHALSQLDQTHQKLVAENAEKQALLQKADDLTQKLRDMASHDALTGLANRTLYFDHLNHSLQMAERNNLKIAVVMIDLDKFKPINDELGHHIGDQVLINVSRRLQGTLRKSDTVARLGGDEFALVLHISNAQDCYGLCQKLLDVLKTPIHLGEQTLSIKASLGISLYPEHGITSDQLLHNADTAMYAAKKVSSHIVVYSREEEAGNKRK